MNSELVASILTGSFTLAAGVLGAILAGFYARRGENRRHQAEVDRHWLADRRAVYAKYLAMAEVMQREVDVIAVFLSYDGKKRIEPEDDEFITEGLRDYIATWEDELQPLLGELQLVASKEVAELADRVSGALMEMTAFLELRRTFTDYYPMWFQTQDLIHVLRNEMRNDLGLVSHGNTARLDEGWPWLESRPSYESYVQNHSRQE